LHGRRSPWGSCWRCRKRVVESIAQLRRARNVLEPGALPEMSVAPGAADNPTLLAEAQRLIHHVSARAQEPKGWRALLALGRSAFDAGFVGHVGLHPAFNLAQVEAEPVDAEATDTGADAPEPEWKAQYESAFSWAMGARLGVKVADVAEVSLVGRFGQVLTRPEFVVTDGESEDRKLAQLVDTTSASRAFYEAGIRASLFGESRSFHGHHDLGVLRPLVEIELGQRWDHRFQDAFTGAADVARFGDRPEQRRYLRVAISGLTVLGEDFELSVGVEREWKATEKGLPEGTKIFLQGRLDLFGLVSGGSKGKE
jgi:hypothetical protein